MNEIHRDNLIPGELYFIEYLSSTDFGEIKKNSHVPIMAGTFNNYILVNSVAGQWRSTAFSWFPANKLLKSPNLSDVYAIPKFDVELNNNWRFYEIRMFKIQKSMETRAINQILKNVTGDEWFLWA